MKNDINIQVTLARLALLLRTSDVQDWAQVLENFHREVETDPDTTRSKILSVFGGMGSFNDLVLYRDGKLLTKENDELDSLRSELYGLCHD